mgnify:CR=1 FL=1
MTGNVAVADETGDTWRGRYLRLCLRTVGIAVVDALKFRRVLFHELCGVGQDFVVVENVTAVQEENVVAGHVGDCLVHGFVDAVVGFLV